MIARLRLLWRALRSRRRFERELDEELAFHLDARREDLERQGMDPEAARRQARIELGQAETHRHACRRARGLAVFDIVSGDLRYAVRGLLFALFNAYGLRAPPLADSGHWVTLEAIDERQSTLGLWSTEEAESLVAEPPAGLRGLYSLREVRLPVTAELTRPVSAEAVSTNYFELLGVPAARGRTFTSQPGGDMQGVVVLSDLGWRRLLDADPDVIGREIEIAARRFTVIGVMPPAFTGTTPVSASFWIGEADYQRLRPQEADASLLVEVSGFLATGTGHEAAAAALTARALAFNPLRDEAVAIADTRVDPRSGYLRAEDLRDLVKASLPIGMAFALLMMVAAANLANLVLARFSARQREMAVPRW